MSTRGRLTAAYGMLVMGTLIVFAIAFSSIYRVRANEVALDAQRQADSIASTIRALQAAADTLISLDTTQSPPIARPTRTLIDALNRLPGYFLVFNNLDRLLYVSGPMRQLTPDDQVAVNKVAVQLPSSIEGATISTPEDSVRLFLRARRISNDTIVVPYIQRVVVGINTNFGDLLAPGVAGTIIIMLPLVFLFSLAAAHLALRNIFRPVDDLINEVEAITDGRSLHRRLQAESENDELSRLSLTVNAMLARLEASFAALRRFTADASHELKTPLTVLRADVERAMHPGTDRAERMVALEEALQETARMSDLVDSLLTLARADEGRFDIHRVPVDLEPLMREVYETAMILGEAAGLELSLSALEGGVVMGDRTRLRQLLLNLITNAIKYTPRGGKVELSVTRRQHDEVAIVVRDTGIGISASDLPHIFDRFWRADRARSRASERGGFGLGLAISQWIVQAHGGTISVQSRLGRGTAFTVLLPIVPDSALPPAAESDEPAAESSI